MSTIDRPYWVRGEVILELTGWDRKRLRRERNDMYGMLKWKNAGTTIYYDINSVHPLLLKVRILESESLSEIQKEIIERFKKSKQRAAQSDESNEEEVTEIKTDSKNRRGPVH